MSETRAPTAPPGAADRAGAADRDDGTDSGPEHVATLSKWLGGLLGTLTVAFSFVGLSSSEVGVVLRNNPVAPTFVMALVVGAIVASVVTVFLGRVRLRTRAALAAVALAVALVPLTVAAIPVSESVAVRVLAAAVATAFGGLAFAAMRVAPRRAADAVGRTVPLQAIAVLLGALLLATAAFAGVRAETASQRSATNPAVSASLAVDDGRLVVEATVGAERLRGVDHVGFEVQGLPATTDRDALCRDAIAALAATAGTAPDDRALDQDRRYCSVEPCAYAAVAGQPCRVVFGANLSPDAAGEIAAELTFPVELGAYRHLRFQAQLCRWRGTGCAWDAADVVNLNLDVPTR